MTKTKPSEEFWRDVFAGYFQDGIARSYEDCVEYACEKHNVTVTFHKPGEEPKRWPDAMTDEERECLHKHWREDQFAIAYKNFAAEMNTPKPEVPRPRARVVYVDGDTELVRDADGLYLHPDGVWYSLQCFYAIGTGQAALDAWRKEEVERGAAD